MRVKWVIWIVVLFLIATPVAATSQMPLGRYHTGLLEVPLDVYEEVTGMKFVEVNESVYEYLIGIAPERRASDSTLYVPKDSLLLLATNPDEGILNLPSSKNNTDYLPPIGDQGIIGSCNAWASTYYVYTYMINWFRGHPHPSTPDVVMNPTFTYNLINHGDDSGSFVADAMQLISTIGAIPYNAFQVYNGYVDGAWEPPYGPNNPASWNQTLVNWSSECNEGNQTACELLNDWHNVVSAIWPEEPQFRMAMYNRGESEMADAAYSLWMGGYSPEVGGTWYVLDLTNQTQFNYLKGLLAAGYIAQTGIVVYDEFMDFNETNNIYALNQEHTGEAGRHAVTIVGYDDNKETPDGKGAFLMVNSWGTSWGDGGYWWLTYQAVQDSTHEISDGKAYIFVPKDQGHYHPVVISKFKITHSKRGEILGGTVTNGYIQAHGGIEFGIGSPQSALWTRWFFNFYMGYVTSGHFNSPSDLASYQAHPFPDTPIILDLSDSVSPLDLQVNSQYVPFFMYLADKNPDGITGTLDSFEVVVNSTYLHKIVKSTELPVAIPENGNWLTVSVNVPVVDYVGITPIQKEILNTNWAFIEIGSLVNASSATLTVGESKYTMQSDSPKHFYYNLTGLDNGVYTYKVTVTFQNGNTVTLPLRTFSVNAEDLTVYISSDSSSWASTETVAPGDVAYVDNTFVWKNVAGGEYSPFTGIYYHLTDLEAKYDSENGMLLFKIGVTPLDNLGSVPASLLNISFDTNGDGNWDYYAVVDLSKPGTKPGVANVLDLYDSDGANVGNLETVFIPVPSDSAVYVQIPDDAIGVSGQSRITIRVQLYEHDDIYGPLDVLMTSGGETTATLDLTQVPTFSNMALVGLVLLVGILFFRRI